ncbi:MAG: diguanylate cyclase [Pseudomonadota bacterium]
MLGTVLFIGEKTAATQAFLAELHCAYFSCHIAETPDAAQLILRSKSIDAVVVQADFSNFDTIALCRKLRRHPSACHLPIILVQMNLKGADWGRALVAGIDDILPFEPSKLTSTIHRLKFLIREYAEISALQSQIGKYVPSGLREFGAEFDHRLQVFSLDKDFKPRFPKGGQGPSYSQQDNTVLIASSLTQELDLLDLRNGPDGDALNILCEATNGSKRSRHLLELGADDLFEGSDTGGLTLRLAALKFRKNRKTQLRAKLEAQIAQAHFDPLTSLLNRHAGLELAQDSVIAANETAAPLCVMVIDIDRFKDINDQFGHALGDRILQKSALRLKHHIRDPDILFRYGGDEFVVILPKTDQATADRISKRLKSTFRTPIRDAAKEHYITISIGAAYLTDPSQELADLIDLADQNMYRDKRTPTQQDLFLPDALPRIA